MYGLVTSSDNGATWQHYDIGSVHPGYLRLSSAERDAQYIMRTDRVRVRVLDAQGETLSEYVPA